ncbi:MAG TPA: ABC transporter substrate-binding protein [Gemmatimonadales bacterium]|nr:ABC transporter substrate-binding protein [Gemmatimonadales bacterium]
MLARLRRAFFVVQIPSLLLLSLAACGDGGGPIRIGLAGPFSDPVGAPMKRAAEMAVEEINTAGGVQGRPLELVMRDDFGDPDSAVAVAAALVAEKVVAVIGHVYSGTTLAAAPVYNEGNDPVVQISPSSSSPDVTNAGAYTFRVCPSDLAHGAALARFAREQLGLDRGAILYLNDDYGRGIRRTFTSEFTQRGGTVLESDPYLGSTPNVDAYLDRIVLRNRSQFVLVAGNRSEAEEALLGARKRGLKVPFMGGDGLEGIEEAGPLAEGTYVSAAYLPGVDSPKNRQFTVSYRRKYPEAGLPNQPAAATYDVVYLLRDVIGVAGTRRKAIREAVAKVGRTTPAFEGVTGKIAFDENGDVPDQRVIIGIVHGGNVQPAGGQ